MFERAGNRKATHYGSHLPTTLRYILQLPKALLRGATNGQNKDERVGWREAQPMAAAATASPKISTQGEKVLSDDTTSLFRS